MIWEFVAGLAAALKQARRVGDVVDATSFEDRTSRLKPLFLLQFLLFDPKFSLYRSEIVFEGAKALCGGLYEHQRYRLTSTKVPRRFQVTPPLLPGSRKCHSLIRVGSQIRDSCNKPATRITRSGGLLLRFGRVSVDFCSRAKRVRV